MLDALTVAVANGLWHLHWDVWCPKCGAPLQASEQLGNLSPRARCPHCHHEAEVYLDQAVSVTATVDARLRRLHPRRRDNPDFRQQVDARLGRLPALQMVNRALFRHILDEQVLPPRHSLGVGHLVVFFSDLKDSTRLYQRLGDAAAYNLVQQHFQAILQAVERHGGAAVKTMGDGVMGTFFHRADALRGVLEAARALQALNRQIGLQGDERLQLKVGLHAGPCIVVTMNRRLDYFGSTVNIAARLSDLSRGSEVLIGETVLNDPAARALAEQHGRLVAMDAPLRGVLQPVPIYRLSLP